MFVLQVILAVVGIAVLLLGRLPLGEREVRNPLSSLIAIVLIVQLPICMFVLALMVGGTAARLRGPVNFDAAYRLTLADFWWVRPAFTLLTLAVAGGLAWVGLKTQAENDDLPLPSAPIAPSEALERARQANGQSDAFTSSPGAPPWMQTQAPETPAVPLVVGRYRAAPKCVPPEVEALGRAEKLFKPSTVGGLLAWWEGAKECVQVVYADALVTVQDDDFTVVPFAAVRSLSGRTLTTQDGQTFEVSPHVEDATRLLQIVRAKVRDRLTSAARAALDAGESVEFGPLTVTSAGLRYREKSLEWFEIAHVRTHSTENGPTLFISAGGSGLPWCMVPLDKVPNDFVLLELIGRLAPGSMAGSYTY